jgi:Spy/CpxP family protein refolding chaperone
MIAHLSLSLLLAAALHAQLPDAKAVLNLTDNQIQNLVQLQQQKVQAVQPLTQQAQERQQKLQQLLDTSPDPAAVGQLFIEINAIAKQIQQVASNAQQQAMNLLTPDQRAQVQTLGNVLKLQLAAQQAVGLGLVNPPAN